MIHRSAVIVAVASSLGLGGCFWMNPPIASEVIPIENVINQLKYELNDYAQWDTTAAGPSKARACGSNGVAQLHLVPKEAELTISAVRGRTASGEIKLGVIPIGTVTPQLGAGASYETTKSQEIEFKFGFSKGLPPPAKNPGGDVTLGITAALRDLRTSLLEKVDHSIEPCIVPGETKITIIFGVKKSATAGVGADFVVVSIGAEFSGSAEDRQKLLLTMVSTGTPLFIPPGR